MIIINSLIVIHELGHTIIAYLFKVKIEKIYIYPLGGISKYRMSLNINPFKELLILLGGPLFQFFAFFILIIIFPSNYDLIVIYHFGILLFNLLPIYPLDGGRLLNLLIEVFIPYKLSLKISIITSYLLVLIIFFFYNSFKINCIITTFLLLFLISKEKNKINYIYQKFILERYFNNYTFKNSKVINSINMFYRNKKHIIKDNNKYYFEKEYLEKKYNKYRNNY